MPREEKDCPDGLIKLINRPKDWRLEATKVLIEFGQDIKALKRECAAVIGLTILILGVLVKLAVGV
jgi:hypothetical protein